MSSNRQQHSRSEEASEDPADRIDDRKVPGWLRPGVWCCGIFAILLLYFIVYPQILVRMDDAGVFDDWPDGAIAPLEISIVPIMTLADKFPFYAKLAGNP